MLPPGWHSPAIRCREPLPAKMRSTGIGDASSTVWIAGQHLQLVGLHGEVKVSGLEAKKTYRKP